MDITAFSRSQIEEGLKSVRTKNNLRKNDHIRLLFAPVEINNQNFERACDIYSRFDPENYESVVVVETYDKVLDKKLPMPSSRYFETSLGKVPVNDYLRNEFCDEDDDFFIHDEGFSNKMSLFHQLMLLQVQFGAHPFSVLSVQIADEGPAIVKELAYVLEEVLASQRTLLVFCCELANERKKEFERVKEMVEKDNRSGLMNYLNSGESHIRGASAFIAGVIVANAWELDLNFLNGEYEQYRGSLLTAYADRQRVIF